LGKLILGLIELISEIAKLVSLSFRLFGNILVGGILLMLLASVAHYFLPLPILFFELFVAILQATLFAVLTLFYIKMAISEPH
jgi:F-type H+-transporting ATPase subunit a